MNYVSLAKHKNVRCILHLHQSFEIVCANEGVVKMTVGGKPRLIETGQATVIMPLEAHSFDENGENECMVFVFSENLAADFCEKVTGSVPQRSVCTLDKTVFDYVCTSFFDTESRSDMLSVRSLLYPICAELYKKCGFVKQNTVKNSTYYKAIEYTVANFLEISSLSDTARALGVNSSYLSRIFKQNSITDYTRYLNTLKCSCAAKLLDSKYPEYNISEIAMQSGFGSIRSFNRSFKENFFVTPKEYIKQKGL